MFWNIATFLYSLDLTQLKQYLISNLKKHCIQLVSRVPKQLKNVKFGRRQNLRNSLPYKYFGHMGQNLRKTLYQSFLVLANFIWYIYFFVPIIFVQDFRLKEHSRLNELWWAYWDRYSKVNKTIGFLRKF